MKIDWVPYSAAALVAGAIALAMGGLLMPTVGDTADSLRIAQQQDGRWLAVAVLYFGGSVALTLGLPVVLTLLGSRGGRLGLFGAGVLAIGFIGTAGYAMLLVLFRALVLTGSIDGGLLAALTGDSGLEAFLALWIAAFYLGELMVAWALFTARTTPRWVPGLLVAHVVSLPFAGFLPDRLSSALVLLVAFGLCGIGITASHQNHPTR